MPVQARQTQPSIFPHTRLDINIPATKPRRMNSGSARFNGRRLVARALMPVRTRPESGHRFGLPRPAMKSPGYKTTPDESGSARFNGRRGVARVIDARANPAKIGTPFRPAPPGDFIAGLQNHAGQIRLSPFQRASFGRTGHLCPCEPGPNRDTISVRPARR